VLIEITPLADDAVLSTEGEVPRRLAAARLHDATAARARLTAVWPGLDLHQLSRGSHPFGGLRVAHRLPDPLEVVAMALGDPAGGGQLLWRATTLDAWQVDQRVVSLAEIEGPLADGWMLRIDGARSLPAPISALAADLERVLDVDIALRVELRRATALGTPAVPTKEDRLILQVGGSEHAGSLADRVWFDSPIGTLTATAAHLADVRAAQVDDATTVTFRVPHQRDPRRAARLIASARRSPWPGEPAPEGTPAAEVRNAAAGGWHRLDRDHPVDTTWLAAGGQMLLVNDSATDVLVTLAGGAWHPIPAGTPARAMFDQLAATGLVHTR
jgi:hypothetical protein